LETFKVKPQILPDNPNLEDVFSPAILKELEIALEEIGTLEAVWDDDYKTYVVTHPLYPMVCADDDTEDKAIYRFKGYLCIFIDERMKGHISAADEAETKGKAGKHGGRRKGAGRKPKGDRTRIYVPTAVAEWLKDDANIAKVMKMAMR
jgi:hypothetical protein